VERWSLGIKPDAEMRADPNADAERASHHVRRRSGALDVVIIEGGAFDKEGWGPALGVRGCRESQKKHHQQ
jgi:hypothetical protein